MPVSDELLERVMRSDRSAMTAMLAEVYPSVYRLAHALTGRPGAARQVVHDVLRRSLRVVPKWRRGTVPENWYYHHTLITARGLSPSPPDRRDDVLVKHAAAADPAYVAFVRAIRSLPRQQAEAFLLHHGERLNTRLLGVSMDCSQAAAADHLAAADAAIASVGGDATPALRATLERAYHALVPPANTVHPAARKYVAKHLRPRIIKRVLLAFATLALLAGALYAWRNRDALQERLLPSISKPTSQRVIVR